VAMSFGNDEAALEALSTGLVVFDRTHAGRLRVSGREGAAALQALCGCDVGALAPGGGALVQLQTAPGTWHPATLLALDAGYLVLLPPGCSAAAAERLGGCCADVGGATAAFALLGPGADEALLRVQAAPLAGAPPGCHALFGFQGTPVVVAAGAAGLASPGVTLLADESAAGALWAALTGPLGAVAAGARAWERLRVAEGVPACGPELLHQHASDAATRNALMGLRLPPGSACAVGDAVEDALSGGAMGAVTSACPEDGTALALIRQPQGAAADGARVRVGAQRVGGVLQTTAWQARLAQEPAVGTHPPPAKAP